MLFQDYIINNTVTVLILLVSFFDSDTSAYSTYVTLHRKL